MFGRPGFDTVLAVKDSIINEEIISTAGTQKDKGKDAKEKDSTAFAVADHSNLSCHYCGIKGHIQPDCRKKKRDEQQGTQSKGNKTHSPKGKGGKNKSNRKGKGKTNKGKQGGNRQSNNWWTHESAPSDAGYDGNYSHGKGQPQPWNSYKGQQQHGKGHSYSNGKGKGRGRGWSSGNFPSDYPGSYANVHQDSSNDQDAYSQSQWSDLPSQRWTEEHQDISFVLLHNAHSTEESSSSSTNQPLQSDDSASLPIVDSWPTYEYTPPSATLAGTRADLPLLFQINIHYDPHYAPFPIMVRANMEISELIVMLASTFNTKRVFFFLFYDFRLCEHRQRLQDIHGLVSGSTLLLVYWDLEQALVFHSLYNRLDSLDTAELYWNFHTQHFQREHPRLSRQQCASPAIHTASPASHQYASPATHTASPASNQSASPAITAYASPVSPVTLSRSFAASVTLNPAQTRSKYYAIRRGRIAFPTIVHSWADCSLLVTGFPNAEFKSFRLLADAEAYLFSEGAPDIAFFSLHHDGVPDALSSPVSQQQASSDHLPVLPVGGWAHRQSHRQCYLCQE
jgi:hypothetical protein